MNIAVSNTALPFVNGRSVSENNAGVLDLVNPSTKETFCEVAVSSEQVVEAAVVAAVSAQREWLSLEPSSRAEVLERFARAIETAAPEVALLDAISVGRPVSSTTEETRGLAAIPRYWANLMTAGLLSRGDLLSVIPAHLTFTTREPLGVVAVLQPWNGPAASFVEAVGAVVACGNAVVVKPSEISPLAALHLAELFSQSGAPDGLVNVLPGAGDVGEHLIKQDAVKGVSFTGSVETGRKVAALAGEGLKKVTLELGGKSPNIVFADADLSSAVPGSVWGIFYNSGQVCCAGTRILVQRPIVEEFKSRLFDLTSRIRVGDATEPDVQMGPVASNQQFARVRNYIDMAREEDAELFFGGAPKTSTLENDGLFIMPTIISNLAEGSKVVQEEIFGPVVAIVPFDSEEEAITLANSTVYGLAAKVWTENLGRMLRLAEQLDVGMVWGNSPWVSHVSLPFGGRKNSGVGAVNGVASIEAFTQLKSVGIRYSQGMKRLPHWPAV